MIYYQAWSHFVAAWQFVWSDVEWTLTDYATEAGLPWPGVLTTITAVLAFLCPFSIMAGFVTRFMASLAIVTYLFMLLTRLPFSEWLNPQCFFLYISISLVFVFYGPGKLSLDALFTKRKAAPRFP